MLASAFYASGGPFGVFHSANSLMREPAAAYLLSQAKKYRALKEAIDEGMADVEAGRVVPWDLEDFLKQARAQAQR